MKLSTLMLCSFSLSGCVSPYPGVEALESHSVCQGFDCKKGPGTFPDNRAAHRPTKDEKIRARQGLPPDFGAENITIGIPIHF